MHFQWHVDSDVHLPVSARVLLYQLVFAHNLVDWCQHLRQGLPRLRLANLHLFHGQPESIILLASAAVSAFFPHVILLTLFRVVTEGQSADPRSGRILLLRLAQSLVERRIEGGRLEVILRVAHRDARAAPMVLVLGRNVPLCRRRILPEGGWTLVEWRRERQR